MVIGVCGIDREGTHWHLTTDEAIAGMQRGDWLLFMLDGESPSWVVIREANGRQYLRAEGQDAEPDRLLGLPECRHAY